MNSRVKSMLGFLATVAGMTVFVLLQDWNFKAPPPPPGVRVHIPEGCSVQHDVTTCLRNPFFPFCRKINVSMDAFYEVKKPGPLSDILLVVVFNNPKYELIPFLEFMYRRHFRYIFYCGDNRTRYWDDFERTFPRPLDYVETHFHGGEWGYKCMMEAIKRNYSVKGYIHLSDDVLLNPWNMRHLPRNVPWFYKEVKKAARNQTTVADIWKNKSWWPWTSHKGKGPLLRTWKHLENLAANGSQEERTRVRTFLTRLATASGSKNNVYYYASDMWYLPASKGREFLFLMKIFDLYRNYLEIAIPTVLYGLGLPVKLISGTYLWYGERTNFSQSYSPHTVFFHPFKLAQYFYWKSGPPFFCKRYFPLLQKDLQN